METWPEMKARHKRERYEMMASMTDYTIIDAAKILRINENQLRTYAWRDGLQFKSNQSKGFTSTKKEQTQ